MLQSAKELGEMKPRLQKFNSITRTRYGHLIFNVNDIYLGKALELYGEWSQGEVDLLLSLIKNDDVVIDAGAHIGTLTVPLAQKAKIVYAFEPQPYLFHILCGNVAINSLTNVIPLLEAVGAKDDRIEVPMLNPTIKNNFGGLSLINYHGLPPPSYDGKSVIVPLVTIDSLNLSKCNLIKIDVEGMEKDVILGAKETIKKLRPILYVEADRPQLRNKILKTIESFDYNMWQHHPPLFNPQNFKANQQNEFGEVVSVNVLSLPMPMRLPNHLKDKVYKLERVENAS